VIVAAVLLAMLVLLGLALYLQGEARHSGRGTLMVATGGSLIASASVCSLVVVLRLVVTG